jgi:ubiquilin
MSTITITIKCSNASSSTVLIEHTATVADLKEKISQELSVAASLQRLIFRGRVLKDENTLDFYQISDGQTVHLVKSNPNVNNNATAASAATTATTTPLTQANNNPYAAGANANPFMGLGGFPGLGGAPDMARMQEQLMRNPEMMQQIMNSPMMENMMNNPEMMRNMMLNNPQMQAMLDSNPQVRHILNDPAVNKFFYVYCITLYYKNL